MSEIDTALTFYYDCGKYEESMSEPKRPYYDPDVLRQKRENEYMPPQKKRGVVVPVSDWSIAGVLFWNRDKRGRVKPPNV